MLPLKCPICKKLSSWKGNPYRPFCSERCKLIDLGAWASGEYRIPVEKVKYERKSESEEKD